MPIQLINVDLEIYSSECLDVICAEFSHTEISHLHNGKSGRGYHANFEVNNRGENAEALITCMCDTIDDFDDRARMAWDNAHTKIFDIGYEAVDSETSFSDSITNATLSRIVSLGASLNMVVYPREIEDNNCDGSALIIREEKSS